MHGTLSLPMRQLNAFSPSWLALSRLTGGLCIGCAAAGFALSLGLSACEQPAGGADRSTLAPILRGSGTDAASRGARCIAPNPAAAPAASARQHRTGKRRAIIV